MAGEAELNRSSGFQHTESPSQRRQRHLRGSDSCAHRGAALHRQRHNEVLHGRQIHLADHHRQAQPLPLGNGSTDPESDGQDVLQRRKCHRLHRDRLPPRRPPHLRLPRSPAGGQPHQCHRSDTAVGERRTAVQGPERSDRHSAGHRHLGDKPDHSPHEHGWAGRLCILRASGRYIQGEGGQLQDRDDIRHDRVPRRDDHHIRTAGAGRPQQGDGGGPLPLRRGRLHRRRLRRLDGHRRFSGMPQ